MEEPSLHTSFEKEREGGEEEEAERRLLLLGRLSRILLFEERSPRFTIVLGRIAILEESMSRGHMLVGGFSAFRPGETFSANFLSPILGTVTTDELVVESA
ncbi:hypothetical protein ACLOJK_036673 [Asimina triloba]